MVFNGFGSGIIRLMIGCSNRNSPETPDPAAAQLAEVRRRIAQVESGEVVLVPGDEALARVRQLVASAKVGGENGQLRNLRH